jgi:hypothetical protein
MKRFVQFSLVNALWIASAAHADVTMRSKMDYRLGSFIPPAAAEGMKTQMAGLVENGTIVRIKGARSFTSTGSLQIIMDQDKGTITILDPKGKRYATTTLADYPEAAKKAMPVLPPDSQRLLENIKIDVKTDKTGQTSIIKGIKAEEILVTVTMEMPGPMAAMGSTKMEMHLWTAAKEELDRVPALKELAAYSGSKGAGMTGATVTKMFSAMPGFGEKLKAPVEELLKASSQVVLGMNMKMIVPGSAKMMGAQNPEEPLAEITSDVAELSSDAIPDSAFQVPAGYEKAELDDLIQLMNPMRQMAQPKQ